MLVGTSFDRRSSIGGRSLDINAIQKGEEKPYKQLSPVNRRNYEQLK
jgi:hypothetical protein